MIAHFRIIFFAFLALALGIWLTSLCYYASSLYLIIFVSCIGLMLIIALFYLLFKNKFFSFFWNIKWHLVLIAVFIGLGVGLFHIAVAQHQVNFIPEKKVTYGISGIVDTNYIEKEKGVYFILSDAKVINNGIDQDLNFNVFVYMYYPEDGGRYSEQELEKILPGNFVYMTSKIVYTPVFDDEINTFAYSSGFQYSCFTSLDNVVAIDGKMGFWDSIREHIRGMYKENMDEIYAGLAFSILVGDKTELDPNISNNFAISGIFHVIAVSGLNTAFIVMLLMFFLKKLRIKWLKLGIVLTVLVFYAILCDLTPSVVRASLMSIFLLITHLFGKQGDNLTSISLSGIIILLFYPLYVFDLGFLLSYAGTFGIFLLYKPLTRLFERMKFKKLSSPLALTLSATIATTPLIVNAFGYMPTWGLIGNLILVPLFGYAFMLLFLVTVVALILPFFAKVLWLMQWGFWLVDKGAWLITLLPYNMIYPKPTPSWGLVGYYTGCFYMSNFCVAKAPIKYSLVASSFAVFWIAFILAQCFTL